MATKHSQHYDAQTGEFKDYPSYMTPQQYHWLRSRTPEQLMETIGRLRKQNKRLKARIKRVLKQQNLG